MGAVVHLDDYRKTPRKRTPQETIENCDTIARWVEEDQARARDAREDARKLAEYIAAFERRVREGETL